MTLAASSVQLFEEAIRNAPDNDEEILSQFSCRKCLDSASGFYYDPLGGLTRCDCKLERLRVERFNRAVALAPKQFQWIIDGLNSIPEMPDVHLKQPELLKRLRGTDGEEKPNSEKSYYFFGKPGTHKTTLALALLQEAGRRGMKCYYEVGRSVVDVIRTYQNTNEIQRNADGKPKDFYSLAQLESEERICLLIDEIEDTATSLTPYTMSILFGIFERCQAYKHQLLITSNVSLDNLLNRWITRDFDGKADAANYANKIYRRIGETCVDVDLT